LIYICSFCRWQVWWRRIAVDAGGSAGAWGLRCGAERRRFLVGLDPWATGSAILPAFRRAGRWFRRKELWEAAAEEESGGCIVGLAAVVCWLLPFGCCGRDRRRKKICWSWSVDRERLRVQGKKETVEVWVVLVWGRRKGWSVERGSDANNEEVLVFFAKEPGGVKGR
jgi:hypothetical protein